MACAFYNSLSAEEQEWYASCADDEAELRFQIACDKEYMLEEADLCLQAQGVSDQLIDALVYNVGTIGTC
jgi:hypothetical protein